MADKEEVEPPSEASPAQPPDASETSADLTSLPTGVNGAEAKKDEASRNSSSEEVLEPAGVAAAASGAKAKTARLVVPPGRRRCSHQQARSAGQAGAYDAAEVRSAIHRRTAQGRVPTGQQLINYFVVVLVFVLFVIAYVSLLDLGLGWAIFKIFS